MLTKHFCGIALLLGVAVGAAAQAKEKMGYELVGDYAGSDSLKGSNADLMLIAAWRCFSNTETIVMGVDFKANGISIGDVEKKLDLRPEDRSLLEKGFKYEGPTDSEIGRIHAQCLIDEHKRITSEEF